MAAINCDLPPSHSSFPIPAICPTLFQASEVSISLFKTCLLSCKAWLPQFYSPPHNQRFTTQRIKVLALEPESARLKYGFVLSKVAMGMLLNLYVLQFS